MDKIAREELVLVAGATGYIGARLIPRLLEQGYRVRALARAPAKLRQRPWAGHPNLEIAVADLFDRDGLLAACQGCWAAYYLVHSMDSSSSDFARSDRIAARNMVVCAEQAGLDRLIYLGGLGEDSPWLSEHLRSRAEVAEILGDGHVPVTIFRAAMIIGSGSASFEILRYLVERLPVMLTPRWVDTECQPIGVRNVLHYLVACLDNDQTVGQIYDIGQQDVLTYRQLMELFAEEAGLRKRLIIPVPVLTPRLSSYWIHLVTPVPATLARPLAEGLRNRVVCADRRVEELLPQDLLDCRQAIRLALEKIHGQQVESSWTDAGLIPPAEWAVPGDPGWAGGTCYSDSRWTVIDAPIEQVWKAVICIGGDNGWYYADWLWWLRGLLDRFSGGVGLQRGRRCPTEIFPGDALDFWRVSEVEPQSRLLLAAEMKMPGCATLEFQLQELSGEQTRLTLNARFLPRGIAGIAYWYAVMPLHNLVFNGMLRGIAQRLGATVVSGPNRSQDALG
ncbi:MAG: DUF2867 domain-containing protein [Desulfuromonas sp.]|nr:MAG: DUF2867 domain-containing protein [Desulfuromonas sp.]